ncbi:uncharacterized protein LOC117303850 [Asterias rubens]|uniref:uncharacterized protein LOC117303850 n=1 Tax=Asterias rubens TaxID=7604 RepID=UPI001455B3DD|nr:uncharacterized protein LOC117303850 [Asterias rubens]
MAKNKLYYIWNFIEKPGKPKSPFNSFLEMWTETTNYVKKNPQFLSTQLHRNLNPTGGAFPCVNHAAFDGTDFEGFGKPTPKWFEVLKATTGDTVAHPGGYLEFGTTTGKPLGPWLPKDDKTTFIVTAFKAGDEKDAKAQEAFEKDWKESSGTNFILKNAPKELGISYCGLYKKFTERPGILYVLRAELTGAGEDSEPAKTFLAQLKEFKYPDYFQKVDTDLFKPDQENIHFSEGGVRELPAGFVWKP